MQPTAHGLWTRWFSSAPEVFTTKIIPTLMVTFFFQCFLSDLLRYSVSFREGNGTPLQYSCLENPRDGGAWWAAVHGVAKSRTRLGDLTFTFHFHALEKEMATHSSVLAWRIPGTEEPGGLPSMGSHRVGHDWSDLAAAAAANHWGNGQDCLNASDYIYSIFLLRAWKI